MNTISAPKLTKPETNLLNKLAEKYGVNPSGFQDEVELFNRFTGVSVKTTPLVAMLYNFTIDAISSYEMRGDGKMFYNNVPVAIDTYDRVRYLILKLDRKAYYDLVD